MRKGLQALDDAIKSAESGGGFSGRLGYFNLKADESIIVRFLTDMPDVLTVDFYEFILDNKQKPQNFVVRTDLLEDPSATDYVLEYGGLQQDFQTKELGPPTPKTRTVGLAVVLKEVVKENPGGRPIMTYVPEEVDIETKKDGTVKGYRFIIVKQAYKNFWTPLRGFYKEYGTISDRPYKITRIGKNNDTTYSIIPKSEDPDWKMDGSSHQALLESFGYGQPPVEGPERFKRCPMTLDEWAEDSCSEKRVKFFLGSLEEREKTEGGNSDASESSSATNGSGTSATSNTADDEAQAAPPAASGFGGASLQERLQAHQ